MAAASADTQPPRLTCDSGESGVRVPFSEK
jgi:hypothetical protein